MKPERRYRAWWTMIIAVALSTAMPLADAAPTYPHSETVSAAQDIAGVADAVLEPIQWLGLAAGGHEGRQAVAELRGHVMNALDALPLAAASWEDVERLAVPGSESNLEAIHQQAEIALLFGDYARCETFAGILLAKARNADSIPQQGLALNYLGVLERRRGNLDRALEHLTRALATLGDQGYASERATVMTNLGNVQRDRGEYARALDLQLQALSIRERIGDRLETSYRTLALLYRDIEDTASATDHFDRALQAAAARGDPIILAPVLGSRARLFNDTGDYARALTEAQEALGIDERIGNRPSQGLERLEIGRALLGLNRRAEATAHFEAVLELGRELEQREIVARALLHLAEIALLERDQLRARGLLDEAIAGLERARVRPQLAQAYALRERLALSQRDTETALRYAHRYAEQREILLGTRASQQLAALQVRNARADAEQRVALLEKDNELQAMRLRERSLERTLTLGALVGLALLLVLGVLRFIGVTRANRALEQKNAEILAQREALSAANTQLSRHAAELYQAAISDPLTGVANRGHLLNELDRRLRASIAERRELSVLVIDFDHFKQINDARGHLHGDRVLVAGAQAMRGLLRTEDLIARFGGEEFVIVIGDTDLDAVMALAERLRANVPAALADEPMAASNCTISVGVASLSQLSEPSVDALLDAADRAMYAAKSRGRDRVVRYAS